MKMEPQLIEKAAHYIQRKEYPTNRSLFKPLKAKETTFAMFVKKHTVIKKVIVSY